MISGRIRRSGAFGSYSFARVNAASSVSSKTSLPPFAVRRSAQGGPMPCAPPAMMTVFLRRHAMSSSMTLSSILCMVVQRFPSRKSGLIYSPISRVHVELFMKCL